jgi:hypothetical protein
LREAKPSIPPGYERGSLFEKIVLSQALC